MVKAEILLIVLMSLISGSIQDGNYDPNTDGVVALSQTNFQSEVLNTDQSWLVVMEFSGPGCDGCIKWSEVVKKTVPLLKEKNIKVGSVDYSKPEGKALIDALKITQFPAVYIYGHDKGNPTRFPYDPKGEQELADAVVFFLNKPPPAQGQCGKDTTPDEQTNTYELTDVNFKEVVLDCNEAWLINFYAPNTKLCNEFIPYFEAAAREFKGQLKFGSIYQLMSTVAAEYNAPLFCTVKLFPAGDKSVKPVDFNNGQHSVHFDNNLIPWIKENLGLRNPGTSAPATSPPATGKVTDLTSQKDLDSKCRKPEVTTCFFLFTAPADQCNADCKLANQNLLTRVSDEMNGENFAWFLSTDENQPDFQNTFGVKGFPGIIAVDRKANTYNFVAGTVDENQLKEFLHSSVDGKLRSKILPFV